MFRIRNLNNAYMYFSDRQDGFSVAPYDSLNIAQHVGDDVGAVLKNREKLQSLVSDQKKVADHRDWIFLNQTHEPNIFFADEQIYDPLNPPVADASITMRKSLPLVVMTADCGPLVIAGQNIVAVVHASWRTVEQGLIQKTVSEMRKRSAGDTLNAFLGPCIYPHTYEFDEKLLEELAKKMGEDVVSKTREGTPSFNLPQSIINACKDSGIGCEELGVNTFDSPNHFSYRQDKVTGRQAGIIWME